MKYNFTLITLHETSFVVKLKVKLSVYFQIKNGGAVCNNQLDWSKEKLKN